MLLFLIFLVSVTLIRIAQTKPFHHGGYKGFDEGERSPSQKSERDWDEGRLGGL